MYKGIQSEVINTTRFDENFDISITYLGKILEQVRLKQKINFLHQHKGIQ